MPPRKQAAQRPKVECKCGAPVTGYVDPTGASEPEEAARLLHFDPKTLKGYFTCRHGNEFAYSEVKE
jgi:hypothetical protein